MLQTQVFGILTKTRFIVPCNVWIMTLNNGYAIHSSFSFKFKLRSCVRNDLTVVLSHYPVSVHRGYGLIIAYVILKLKFIAQFPPILANLSWKLKWAFLIPSCPTSVCLFVSVNFSQFWFPLQNHGVNFNQPLKHK